MWWASKISSFDDREKKEFKSSHKKLLQNARDHYWDSFLLNKASSWAAVQYLSLTLIIQKSSLYHSGEALPDAARTPDQANGDRQEKSPEALWSLAHLLALYDLNSPNQEYRIWGLGNLIELYLLALVMKEDDPEELEEFTRSALRYADMLVDLAGRDAFMIYSTRRQILRYVEWFGKIAQLGKHMINLANRIAKKLPEEVEERWK